MKTSKRTFVRHVGGFVLGGLAAIGLSWTSSAGTYSESPMLSKRVAAGELPPLEERLPETPKVVSLASRKRKVGKYSGKDMRLLMSRSKDVRLMVVYGYARLVGYDEGFALQPDILESVEVKENRVFTLRLRKGHRWSDGHPFTTEDFRYYWEDVAQNEELSPFGLNAKLLVDGKPPKFELVDAQTVRYSWEHPNPYFLSALAGTRPLYIYSPAHFLSKFHKRYANKEALNNQAKGRGQRNWAALHNKMDSPYKNRIPNVPTLQPWINTTKGPSQQFVFVRNPFFHRVDESGQQLPYVDRVRMQISDKKLIPAKTGAGDSDLQARSLKFSDYTFLKRNEKRSKLNIRLWRTTKGAHIALFPNLNVRDPVLRKVVRDVRFRRAVSMAIDRHEINQVIYHGFAAEGNNTVHERSPLFKPHYRTKWATFDPRAAAELLDEMGLDQKGDDGIRLLPDGRPVQIVVETAGESSEESDVLELTHDSLLKVGIKIFTKPVQREVFRNRIFAGETLFSVWGGLENGVANAGTAPHELAPTSQQQLQWPKWGQHFQNKGGAGEAPDIPEAVELLALFNRWAVASSVQEQREIWHRMLEIYTDQVFTIGLIAGVPQPVVTTERLQNVPKKGVYNWEPGAHFGVYGPDTFWFK